MSKWIIILLLLISTPAYADIVSLDANYVPGQSNVVDKLNSDRMKLTNGINNIRGSATGSGQSSGQIKAHTVGEENMYADASPRQYLADLFIKNVDGNNGLVASGLEFGASGSLTSSATPGTAYTMGYRIEKTDSTPHTFTASKWTYTFVCQDGSLDYLERNIGTTITTSEYPTNCQPLSRVSTDSSTVLNVTDLRKTKFTLESYDSVYDVATESSLKDLFVGNGNPYRVGSQLRYTSASVYTVTAGAAMINGYARDRISFSSDPAYPVASTSDSDGLDQGTMGNGTYYVYLVADQSSTPTYRVVHSVNSNAPTGKTNYLKIGEFYNNGAISANSMVTYENGEKNPAKAQYAKGWVKFTGATVNILGSYNVSAVIDNGANGDYTIVWDTDFSNTNYVVVGNTDAEPGGPTYCIVNPITYAVGSISILTVSVVTDTKLDSAVVNVAAFGDQS